MPRGFFSKTVLATQRLPLPMMARCGACGLFKTCESPKMPVSGKGKRKVLIVGEAPGADEDAKGLQFVGKAGRRLKDTLERLKVDLRRDCRVTNALICFVGETVVESPSKVYRVYRRRYDGLLLRIKTAAGRVFTGTPNHPVLTPNGWVSLGLVKEGDDLIDCPPTQRTEFGRTDVDDPPPTIKEVFDALSDLGEVHRVVGGSMDFHGDGEDGDVDVVTVDGLLWDRIEATVCEHRGKSSLVSPDERSPDLLGPGGLPDPRQDFGSGFFRPPDSLVSGRGEGLSSLLPHPAETFLHALTSGSDRLSGPTKEEPNLVPAHTKTPSDTLRALPRPVTTDYVVKVERKTCDQTFDGDDAPYGPTHVYNLETDDGFYIIAHGIIMSNCRPPDNKIDDQDKIEHCRPNLIREIEEFQPETIILLGRSAVKSVIGYLWKEDVGDMGRWVGWKIPCQLWNCWVHPTWHPSYLIRANDHPVLDRMFEDHLRAAFSHEGRPWDEVPDYRSKVEILWKTDDIREGITDLMDSDLPVGFDYETNMLKPDSKRSRIVCCSMSNGKRTIAFPWGAGWTTKFFRAFLRSDVPKIASNKKFEHRWSESVVGVRPRNWLFCTALGAHVLDNRPEIASIKFQGFVQLGMPPWDDHIKPYLESKEKGGYSENKIDQCDPEELMLYCGIDSLVEWEVGMKQMKELGLEVS